MNHRTLKIGDTVSIADGLYEIVNMVYEPVVREHRLFLKLLKSSKRNGDFIAGSYTETFEGSVDGVITDKRSISNA